MTIENTLQEREKTHGDFHNTADAAQAMKRQLQDGARWHDLTPVEQEALHMICTKIARIISGGSHLDHWRDIEGYARLGSRSHLPTGSPELDARTERGLVPPAGIDVAYRPRSLDDPRPWFGQTREGLPARAATPEDVIEILRGKP